MFSVVKKTFRNSLQKPNEWTCFIEYPFPDQNAFLKPGYWTSSFVEEFKKIFIPHMSDKPIGSSGYYLIVDKAGDIVGPVHDHPDAVGKKASSIGLAPAPGSASIQQNKMFSTYLFNDKVACIRFRTIGDLEIYACMPVHEIFNPILMNVALTGLVMLGLAFIFHWMMQRIDKMNMEKEEHLQKELTFARNIQMAELKEKTPDTDRYKVSAVMLPAKEIGGDFYDFYELPGHKLLLGIGDVSGKGMAAAIFMMKMKTALKLGNMICGNMKDAVDLSNNEVCSKNESKMFVTAFGSIFDSETGILDFVNAGHNPPLIIHADGTVEWLKCVPNLPMGIRTGFNYKAQKVQLQHNDRFFLYTDGITEAQNEKGELYGNQRLKHILEQMHDRDDLVEEVVRDVKMFRGKKEQDDDITILTMLYR